MPYHRHSGVRRVTRSSAIKKKTRSVTGHNREPLPSHLHRMENKLLLISQENMAPPRSTMWEARSSPQEL